MISFRRLRAHAGPLVRNRSRRVLLVVAGLLLGTISPGIARAERELVARVMTTGEPAAQWIVILKGAHVELVHAEALVDSGSLSVRATVDEKLLDEKTLMAGVVILADGRMASSSLEPLVFQGSGGAGISRQQLRSIISDRERERSELREALTARVDESPLAPEISELLDLDSEIASLTASPPTP